MISQGLLPWIAVASGGAMGACLRFATTLWLGSPTMPAWPWATFSVNVVGSFMFGVLVVVLTHWVSNDFWRLLLVTGVVGALTTFSTFSFEVVRMVEARAYLLAASYTLASVVVCISAAFAGGMLARGVAH